MQQDLEGAVMKAHPPRPVTITVDFGDGNTYTETFAKCMSVSTVVVSADESGTGGAMVGYSRRTAGMPEHVDQYTAGHIAVLQTEMQGLADQAALRLKVLQSWQLANRPPGGAADAKPSRLVLP